MGPCTDGGGPRYFGLYPAIVTDIVDSDQLGRIEVRFPWLGEDGASVRAWATLLSFYAEKDQGFEVLPSVGTQVVVGFEAGDPRRPYIVGAAWNGKEKLPQAPEAANNKRVLKTRSGSLLEFDDTDGAVKITLSTKGGHKLVLDEGSMELNLTHMNGPHVTMDASGKVDILGNASVDITAPVLNVHAGSAIFDGIVTCQALITQSVVSPLYTPGAGNVW